MAREIQSAASRGASNFDWLPHAVLERFHLKGKLSIVESMDWVKPRRLIVARGPERPADSWSSDGGGFGAQLLARIKCRAGVLRSRSWSEAKGQGSRFDAGRRRRSRRITRG